MNWNRSWRPRRPARGARHRQLAAVLLATAICGCAADVPVGQAESSDQTVLFADEFDGPAGALPGGPWHYAKGGGGWGNKELQTYTDNPENVSLDGNGHLVITALLDGPEGITSARLMTEGSFEFSHGRAEARIALPAGTGLHPAFWLLGSNVDDVSWPECGEIDVIETINLATDYHTGIHAPSAESERGQEIAKSGAVPFPLAGQFRTYWVERSPGKIVTGIDDRTLFTVQPADLAAKGDWVFDDPFFLVLNLAVGSDWSGPPDDSTPNPSRMVVDWVRVTAHPSGR